MTTPNKKKKTTRAPKTHKVFAMPWMLHDRWDGPEHDGWTLAHEAETLLAHAKTVTAERSFHDEVPDTYTSPDGSVEAVEVTTDTFKRIKKGKVLKVAPDTLMKRKP